LAQAFFAVNAWAAPQYAEQISDMAINYLRTPGGRVHPGQTIGRAD
jgi:hypothetical protein